MRSCGTITTVTRTPLSWRRTGVLLGALAAGLPALAGCSNQVEARGTFDEVWIRAQSAVRAARFEIAGTGAMRERIEKDREQGTLKYVWSDDASEDARVLTLTITPAAEAPESKCPAIDRRIHIEAWRWTFGGLAPFSDPRATEEAFRALTAEFDRPLPVTHGGA